MLVISIIDHCQWHWGVSGGHSSYPQQSNPTQSDPTRKHITENTGAETRKCAMYDVQCDLQYWVFSFHLAVHVRVVLVLQNKD